MRTSASVAVFLAAFAQLSAAQQALFINTPASLVECQPTLLNFGGGSGQPYFISVLPAGQVSASPIEQLPEQTSTTYTWTVDLAAGTNISLSIRDSSGAVQYSSPVAIQAGTSQSCLNAAASTSGVTAAAGVASSASSSASSAVASVAVTSAPSTGTLLATATSGSLTVTAASGAPTAVPQANGTTSAGTSYNFTCDAGQGELTYGITTAVLDGVSLAQATNYFANWTATSPGVPVNSSTYFLNAMRTFTINGNITISETLRSNETNATTGSLHQQWNSTDGSVPEALGNGLINYKSFDDFTVYTNTTTNQTNIQYFILACFNDQSTGLTAIASFIESAISYYATQLNGTNSTTAGAATTTAAGARRRAVKLF